MARARTSPRPPKRQRQRPKGDRRRRGAAVEPADPRTSANMKRVRRENTGAEQVVARLLFQATLRGRRHVRGLPGSPDFANRKRRFAVFVNGCFWHHHRGCHRGSTPLANRQFWIAKFRGNRTRDAAAIRRLRSLGFTVMVVWECETRDLETLRGRIARFRATLAGRPELTVRTGPHGQRNLVRARRKAID
jgi:DNA mismatch endonuclease, patch repair protein